MAKKKKNQPVELWIRIDDLEITAAPNKRSADTDRLLRQHNADSFVFIPLAKLGKKGRKLHADPKAIKRKKAKLPDRQWYDGELRSLEGKGTVPGVLAFNVRRRSARSIAEKLGVNQFMWCTSDAPIETHDVKLFEDDSDHAWSKSRTIALVGLTDMWRAVKDATALPMAVEESQTTIEKFWRLVIAVIAAAVAATAVKALVNSMAPPGWISVVMNIAFYPFVIPAVLVGTYLRVLMQRGEAQARDFTAAEAEANWTKVAPHLLALWVLCWAAVMLLTWLQAVPSADFGFLGETGGLTTSFIICVWMLLPIANSHDLESLLESGIEAAVAAAGSIITIKVSLYITNLITDTVLGIIANMLPFAFPEWLQELISAVVNVGAEVVLVAVLLGYAWSRTRQQFMRL